MQPALPVLPQSGPSGGPLTKDAAGSPQAAPVRPQGVVPTKTCKTQNHLSPVVRKFLALEPNILLAFRFDLVSGKPFFLGLVKAILARVACLAQRGCVGKLELGMVMSSMGAASFLHFSGVTCC